MNTATIAVLGISVAALVTLFGFWNSYAESEQDITVILNLIGDTQTDIQQITDRVAEIEAVNTELMQRVNELEQRALNTTMTLLPLTNGSSRY